MVAALTMQVLSLIGAMDLPPASTHIDYSIQTRTSTLLTNMARTFTSDRPPERPKHAKLPMQRVYMPSIPSVPFLFFFLFLEDYSLAVACVTQDSLGLCHRIILGCGHIFIHICLYLESIYPIPPGIYINISHDVSHSYQSKCHRN